QGRDLLHDSGAAWPSSRDCPLPGDQLSVPAQDRVGGHDRRHPSQDPPTESLAFGGEASALVIGQAEAAARQLAPENPVLFDQVLDDLLLVAIDPSGEGHKQGRARRRAWQSFVDSTVAGGELPGNTSATSAEYSDSTGWAPFATRARW